MSRHFPIVAAAEILFEPDVGDDKEVAAAHFLDLQLGLTHPPVSPGDRYHRP